MFNPRASQVLACAPLLIALLLLAGPASAQAPVAPRSFEASPEVYKVVAENDKLRVIKVAWAPGQRDALHSHPANGVYFLSDCELRFFQPDGSSVDFLRIQGSATAGPAIAAHSVQNIGKKPCELIQFEPK